MGTGRPRILLFILGPRCPWSKGTDRLSPGISDLHLYHLGKIILNLRAAAPGACEWLRLDEILDVFRARGVL